MPIPSAIEGAAQSYRYNDKFLRQRTGAIL